jgi:hypothetical protein
MLPPCTSSPFVYDAFTQTDLTRVDLRRSVAVRARFDGILARRARFEHSSLVAVAFQDCDLREAKFAHADLRGATFRACCLEGADFDGAVFGGTEWSGCDLSGAHGLDRALVHCACSFDSVTVARSLELPEALLEAAGAHPLVRGVRGISYRGLPQRAPTWFLSYATPDEVLIRALWERLLRARVPVWFANLDMQMPSPGPDGRSSDYEIARFLRSAIGTNDGAIVLLTRHSHHRPWVKAELQEVARINKVCARNRLPPKRCLGLIADDLPMPWPAHVTEACTKLIDVRAQAAACHYDAVAELVCANL